MPEVNLDNVLLLGTLTLISFGAKVIPSLLLKFEGLKTKEALASGFLLSAPLTLVIVTAELGKELGVIDGHFESILVLLAIFTGILAPILFSLLYEEKKV
jgi:Kef-type K+ transport system membrane component KefB